MAKMTNYLSIRKVKYIVKASIKCFVDYVVAFARALSKSFCTAAVTIGSMSS